jgi:hypothetical protein
MTWFKAFIVLRRSHRALAYQAIRVSLSPWWSVRPGQTLVAGHDVTRSSCVASFKGMRLSMPETVAHDSGPYQTCLLTGNFRAALRGLDHALGCLLEAHTALVATVNGSTKVAKGPWTDFVAPGGIHEVANTGVKTVPRERGRPARRRHGGGHPGATPGGCPRAPRREYAGSRDGRRSVSGGDSR